MREFFFFFFFNWFGRVWVRVRAFFVHKAGEIRGEEMETRTCVGMRACESHGQVTHSLRRRRRRAARAEVFVTTYDRETFQCGLLYTYKPEVC